jgi:hypothetical protein
MMKSMLARAAVCTGAAVIFSRTSKTTAVAEAESGFNFDEKDRKLLARSLVHLRPQEAEMRLRWERDELGWRKLPARAWPPFQPSVADIPTIAAKLQGGNCGVDTTGLLPVTGRSQFTDPALPSTGPVDCTQNAFDLATALLFNNVDASRGMHLFKQLAENRHCVDAHVALGIALIEGLNVEAEPSKGIEHLKAACKRDSAQAYYEMGTAWYSGLAGALEEDERRAFEMFEKAAAQKHTAGQ